MRRSLAVLSAIALIVGATAWTAFAQPAPSPQYPSSIPSPAVPSMPAQPGAGAAVQPSTGMGMGMAGAGPAPGGMMAQGGICMMPSVTVDDSAVYVLRGNELLKLDKNTLQIISSTTLTPVPAGGAAAGATAGAGPSPAPPSPMTVRPETQQTITQMRCMSPADLDQSYMRAVMQAHGGAIAWSKLAETRATHPELRDFARRIVREESQINTQFSRDMQGWYGVRATRDMQRPSAADQAILNNLQSLCGRDFEIAYMQAMITHLTESIAMAQDAMPRLTHSELRETAQSMVRTHCAERDQLLNWLSTWYDIKVQ